MRSTKYPGRPRVTIGIAGTAIVTTRFRVRNLGTTPIITTLERKILMLTAAGEKCQTTVRCGNRLSPRTGRLIVMATGFGNLTTAGRGWDLSRGAGRLITMAAGCITTPRGYGGLDR